MPQSSAPARARWSVRDDLVPQSIEEHRPFLDALHAQHAVLVPVVLGKPLLDGLLGGRVDDVKHVAVTLQRPAEQDEPVVDERVHEPSVFVPTLLLAKTARPVPGPTVLESNREEHGHILIAASAAPEAQARIASAPVTTTTSPCTAPRQAAQSRSDSGR